MSPVGERQPPVTVGRAADPARPHAHVGPVERIVFLAAMVAIALYVLDDAFLHREPGTDVADHPLSGLVPLVLAALSAAVQPRLAAGWRAALALAWAPCALTAGIADGIRHVAIDRLSGGGLFVVLPVCFALLATRHARDPVTAADLGRPYEAVAFETSDGLRLDGWYVPSTNRAAVIVFPGRRGTVSRARLLARHGYGVLVFDRRGEGTSEGDFNARGWGGEPDLVAALDFLAARPDVDPARIGGVGLSVGGELLMAAAAADDRLAAVVSEGAGVRSLREQMLDPDAPAGLRWLSPMAVETAALVVLANDVPPPSLADLVARIAPRPLLLIRARDGNGDEVLNDVYLARAGEPKALWNLSSGGHTGALRADPAAYEHRLVTFFDDALREER